MTITADAEVDLKPAAAVGRGRLLAYCLIVGSAPFILLIASLLIAPTDWTIRHSGNIYLANVGYVTKLKNADCQIVIYGDSAAMEDLDPATLQQRTGLSACNIAEPAGVTMVNGMMIPDLFLQNNPRPKVWVFTFAADNLAPYKSWDTVQTFEAILFRLRARRDLSTLALLAAHPKQTLEFASFGLRLALFGVIKRPLPDSAYAIRSEHRGLYPSPDPTMTECVQERIEHPSDAAYIEAIRARYGVDGSIVIVNTAPKPACDLTFDFYAVQHPAPTDNKLEAYPMSDFDNHGHSHMKESGVARFSNAVSDQIIEALKRKPAPPVAASTSEDQ
jgi:hypothetical protein